MVSWVSLIKEFLVFANLPHTYLRNVTVKVKQELHEHTHLYRFQPTDLMYTIPVCYHAYKVKHQEKSKVCSWKQGLIIFYTGQVFLWPGYELLPLYPYVFSFNSHNKHIKCPDHKLIKTKWNLSWGQSDSNIHVLYSVLGNMLTPQCLHYFHSMYKTVRSPF